MPGARRQHLLRPGLQPHAASSRPAQEWRHRVRLPGEGSRALRRGRVRCRQARHFYRGKAPQAQVPLCRHRPVLLRQRRGGNGQAGATLGPRRAGDHQHQPGLPGARRPQCGTARPRLRLAGYRHPRQPAGSRALRRNHREAPGLQGCLPGRDRLLQRLAERR
ncbi:hypothetical protein D9M71_627730 [compost metagenome]